MQPFLPSLPQGIHLPLFLLPPLLPLSTTFSYTSSELEVGISHFFLKPLDLAKNQEQRKHSHFSLGSLITDFDAWQLGDKI